MERALKQAYGNWVSGPDQFWDRQHEVELFIEYLKDGAHLYLVAQRRIGKTSLMREVARQIEDQFICLQLDLQKSYTAEDFVVELSKATHVHKGHWEKTREVFSNIFGSLDKIEEVQVEEVSLKIRDGLSGGNWEVKGSRLLQMLAEADRPVVLFMDEVPILVNRMLKGPDFQITHERVATVDAFMSWLRQRSIEHQGKIRFVVTGSIGFEPILRQAGLSATINNFRPFELEPWDAETAIGCLHALARHAKLTFAEGAAEQIPQYLGSCIPHHVQMFFSHLYEHGRKRGDMTCSADDVEHVYATRMLSTRGHAELSTFEERLKVMVGDEILPFVLDLLTESAVVGCLSTDAITTFRKEYDLGDRKGLDQTREVIEVLEHDGYLRQTDAGYVFISNLLCDWWKRRFGALGFVTAAERGTEQ